MIARVADQCFWLGRYIERTENTARVLQVTGALALDAELPARRCWHPLVIVSGQEEDYVARFGRDALGDAERVQRYLTRDPKNPVSLLRSIAAARCGCNVFLEAPRLPRSANRRCDLPCSTLPPLNQRGFAPRKLMLSAKHLPK